MEAHVEAVNQRVRESDAETEGQSDRSDYEGVQTKIDEREDGLGSGREDEYVDEDKYTTVTVEPLNDDEDGNGSAGADDESGNEGLKGEEASTQDTSKPSKAASQTAGRAGPAGQQSGQTRPKKRRKKFRYETKQERKTERVRQATKMIAAAKARRNASSL